MPYTFKNRKMIFYAQKDKNKRFNNRNLSCREAQKIRKQFFRLIKTQLNIKLTYKKIGILPKVTIDRLNKKLYKFKDLLESITILTK